MDSACSNYAQLILYLGFFVPLSLISINAGIIIYRIREFSSFQKSLNVNQTQINLREKKVTIMVFLMIGAFLISWSFYAIVCFLRILELNLPDYLGEHS